MAWTVATKDDVRTLFPLDADDLKDQWSDWAEALLLDYLGRSDVADVTSTTNFVEYLSGNGGSVLLTSNPINTLNSVSIVYGDSTVSQSVTNYRNIGNQLLVNKSNTVPDEYEYFPDGYRNIKVDYDTVVPNQEIYKLATVMMIVAMANFEGRKGADADMEWGVIGNSSYASGTATMNVGLVSYLNAILDQVIGKKGRVRIR